jgi:hypothetical protein
VRILTAPSTPVSVSEAHSSLSPGSKQTLMVKAPIGATVTISIRYPNATTKRTHLKIGTSGRSTYSFTVPAGVDTESTQKASITVSSSAGTARTSFTVLRMPVEVYVSHSTLKSGDHQTLRIFGPHRAHVQVQLLYPDGRYALHTAVLDSKGNGSYTFTVPKLQHPHGNTVTVQVTASLPTGLVAAVAHFSVK